MKEIKLWKNKNELSTLVALVDDEDYDRVMEAVITYTPTGKPRKGTGKWYAHEVTPGYIYAMNGPRDVAVHRVIMNAPKGMDVDHINGDRLDNRKENLRICTRAQNCQNKKLRRDSKSGYKGVYERVGRRKYTSKKTGKVTWYVPERKKPFKAYISDPTTAYPKKRHISLGHYATAEEAARVYDKAAKEIHGEFAYLNFPED